LTYLPYLAGAIYLFGFELFVMLFMGLAIGFGIGITVAEVRAKKRHDAFDKAHDDWLEMETGSRTPERQPCAAAPIAVVEEQESKAA
jgi:hypothetical protein